MKSHGIHLEIAGLLKDINLLSLLFSFIQFKFIPRSVNVRADLVAKHALAVMNQF